MIKVKNNPNSYFSLQVLPAIGREDKGQSMQLKAKNRYF
jgi:hypothetical protein